MGSVGVGGVWYVHYGTGLCIIGGSCKNSYALIFRYVQGNRVHRLELEHRSISSSVVSIHHVLLQLWDSSLCVAPIAHAHTACCLGFKSPLGLDFSGITD